MIVLTQFTAWTQDLGFPVIFVLNIYQMIIMRYSLDFKSIH
jgi:hypothetical protein